MADKSPRTGSSTLPISRVKTIMKSSPEVSAISQESLYLISRATELFVQDLAQQTLKEGGKNSVEYPDLAKIVNQKEALMFLQDIIPEKIKAKDYFESVGKKAPWIKEAAKREEFPEAVVIEDSEGEDQETVENEEEGDQEES